MTQDQPQRRHVDTSAFSPKLRSLTQEHGALVDWALRYNGYERLGGGRPSLASIWMIM